MMKTRKIPVKVWGSGFLQRPTIPSEVAVIRPIEVFALRGRISHEILDRLGLCPLSHQIAYGDPGLLYPLLLDGEPQKKYDIGIIPHYFDKEKGRQLFDAITACGIKAVLIDVMDVNPRNTLRQIAKCDTILSSSLHGCIVADSLNIPNRHMSLSTLNLSKDDYALKFRDYYSALNMDWPSPLEEVDLRNGFDALPGRIRREYGVSAEKVVEVKRGLSDSFPL